MRGTTIKIDSYGHKLICINVLARGKLGLLRLGPFPDFAKQGFSPFSLLNAKDSLAGARQPDGLESLAFALPLRLLSIPSVSPCPRLPRHHFRDHRSDCFARGAGFASGFGRASSAPSQYWSLMRNRESFSHRHHCDRDCLRRSCWCSLNDFRSRQPARSPPLRTHPILAAAMPALAGLQLRCGSSAVARPAATGAPAPELSQRADWQCYWSN
jgi:hypothetical protein